MSPASNVIGVDIGGSSIKSALVETRSGRRISDRIACDTPTEFGFEAIVNAVARIRLRHVGDLSLGVGFPAVVRRGCVLTAPTAYEVPGWIGRDLQHALEARCSCDVVVLNDADAAGLAESRFGAANDRTGTVLVLTLGTGIGSALLSGGRLVPNVELGKIVLPNQAQAAERFVAPRIKREEGLGWEAWADRLALYLSHVDRIATPDLIVLGGAVSEESEAFLSRVRARAELRCDLRPAALGNDAGVIGAACAFETLSA